MKLKTKLEALNNPPYPGEIGIYIMNNISQKAWNNWLQQQTRIINENRLNLSDIKSRKLLHDQMIQYLFEKDEIDFSS
ncbi:oxidative damage protection protein [Candidatus Kinetoplastibacterium sorsogonicusi]